MKHLLKIDTTTGPLGKSMVRFAVPVFLSSLAQMLMNAADVAVLGNMAGGVAVASVAATTVVVSLIVSSSAGIAEGTKVLLARAVGAKNYERSRVIVSTSLIFAAVLGIFLAVLGFALSEPLLKLLRCPSDCFDGAVLYLSIYFFSAPLTLIYNYGSVIIATSGNTKRPMIYMLVSGVINVILNIVLCILMENKVAAVAIATVVGIAISAILVVKDLLLLENFAFSFKRLSFSFGECALILKLGIPSALNVAMYSISGLLTQPALNSFGSAAIAGQSAAGHIVSVGNSFLIAIQSAQNTFMGQNLGAGQNERAVRVMKLCTLTSLAIIIPYGILGCIFAEPLLSLIIPGEVEAIAYGKTYAPFVLGFFCMESMKYSFSSSLSVFGKAHWHAISALISVIVFRTFWITVVFKAYPTYIILSLCYSLTWTLGALLDGIFFTFVYRRFKKGKLKSF